jgi:hypothetical protein
VLAMKRRTVAGRRRRTSLLVPLPGERLGAGMEGLYAFDCKLTLPALT